MTVTHPDIPDASPLSRRLMLAGAGIAVAGAILAAIAFATGAGDLRRLLFSLLINFAFFVSLALGALFWVVLHHLTGAGWSVALRRMGEAVAASIGILGLAGLPILALLGAIYPWADPQAVAHDPILQAKQAYLNVPFFSIRYILYFVVWIGLARFFLRHSVRQDAHGDAALTVRMGRFSPLAAILLALTMTFFAFDIVMSLDPHWFSTIFGVYYFSGAFAGFFALLALAAVGARWSGALKAFITPEHLQDVGKILFAFIVFWAYIAFSQYMLIWYGNLPEETLWIARRQEGQWMALTYFLLAGHFFIPFFGLMSRWTKRFGLPLAFWALWMLVMHWLDLYWLIVPEFRHGAQGLGFALSDLAMLLVVGGLFCIGVARPLRRTAALPARDPRLEESLAFENM